MSAKFLVLKFYWISCIVKFSEKQKVKWMKESKHHTETPITWGIQYNTSEESAVIMGISL